MIKSAFPEELNADVEAVCRALLVESRAYDEALISEQSTEWKLTNGEIIKVPYRIYIDDYLLTLKKMTECRKIIYHCIFSRSSDGYIRQKHICALLDMDLPEWAMPYVIKVCDEYVKEILDIVYEKLKNENCHAYKNLCRLNLKNIQSGHSRMMSYWRRYYWRDNCDYNGYIGKRLFAECFGYRKTGQKLINI